MKDTTEDQVVQRLVQWAEKQEPIRAMLLYSSRANPNAPVDVFSDYDVLLAVADIHPFHKDDRWLGDFGKVLVVFRNPIGLEYGFESNDSAYVAKNLWRDNLFQMKYCLDYVMKFQCLRKMLEWRMEIEHNWSVKPGAYGKGLKKRIKPEIWSELERTYVGAG